MGYSKALDGYTVKEIFTTKLRGEPFDVLRSTLARDLDEWLIDREIFERAYDLRRNDRYTYRCLCPVRIWYRNGKGTHSQINRDWLTPGDIWTF